jgi:hypothetical protein
LTATRVAKLLLLVVCLGLQGWAIKLRHRSVPCLVFGSPPASSEQQTPPVLRSWGPYRAEESFRITGEAAVTLHLALDSEGQVLGLRVLKVELGEPDECTAAEVRKAEAEHYLTTVLAHSTWGPAEEGGRYVPFATDRYVVRIKRSQADTSTDTTPPPGSQGGDGYATPGAPGPSLQQQGLHAQPLDSAAPTTEAPAASPGPQSPAAASP